MSRRGEDGLGRPMGPPDSMRAAAEAAMRARPRRRCRVCGAEGHPLHPDLVDRWFGAPGRWSLARCSDPGCGLAWLDPMPIAEDLHLAYVRYYTHHTPAAGGPLRPLYDHAVAGYLSSRFGYRPVGVTAVHRTLGLLFHLIPARRETLDLMALHLRPVPGGRLLDVGCGDGARLPVLARLGWSTEGIDPDPKAVERARALGRAVRVGTLDAEPIGPDYDAVTLSHVIEHVPDPVATLEACRHALRPGGQLVIATPNLASLGHRRFGARWRGLEPPRHLHVFDRTSLARTVSGAGFEVRACFTTARIASVIARESLAPERSGGLAIRLAGAAFAVRERFALLGDAEAGEEVVLCASAPAAQSSGGGSPATSAS